MKQSDTANTSILFRVGQGDEDAWRSLTQIYGPVVYGWGRRRGLQESDASDIVQDVFTTVAAKIHQHRGQRFRAWLWTIFRTRLVDHYRRLDGLPRPTGGSTANVRIQELPDTPPAASTDEGQRENAEIQSRALRLLRDKFEDHIWDSFWRTAVEGDAPNDVAADLGVSVWVVYNAKSRVLKRLRRELDGLEGIRLDEAAD